MRFSAQVLLSRATPCIALEGVTPVTPSGASGQGKSVGGIGLVRRSGLDPPTGAATSNENIDSAMAVDNIKLMREVLVYPGEDGSWVADCPSLPGCVSQGETREDAIKNIKEAIEGYVLVLQEDGLPVPKERFEAMVVAV